MAGVGSGGRSGEGYSARVLSQDRIGRRSGCRISLSYDQPGRRTTGGELSELRDPYGQIDPWSEPCRDYIESCYRHRTVQPHGHAVALHDKMPGRMERAFTEGRCLASFRPQPLARLRRKASKYPIDPGCPARSGCGPAGGPTRRLAVPRAVSRKTYCGGKSRRPRSSSAITKWCASVLSGDLTCIIPSTDTQSSLTQRDKRALVRADQGCSRCQIAKDRSLPRISSGM
jgi:hypothetical protein